QAVRRLSGRQHEPLLVGGKGKGPRSQNWVWYPISALCQMAPVARATDLTPGQDRLTAPAQQDVSVSPPPRDAARRGRPAAGATGPQGRGAAVRRPPRRPSLAANHPSTAPLGPGDSCRNREARRRRRASTCDVTDPRTT